MKEARRASTSCFRVAARAGPVRMWRRAHGTGCMRHKEGGVVRLGRRAGADDRGIGVGGCAKTARCSVSFMSAIGMRSRTRRAALWVWRAGYMVLLPIVICRLRLHPLVYDIL